MGATLTYKFVICFIELNKLRLTSNILISISLVLLTSNKTHLLFGKEILAGMAPVIVELAISSFGLL